MKVPLRLFLALSIIPTALHATGRSAPARSRTGSAGPVGLALPAPVRLNTVVLNSLSLSAAQSLPVPSLAAAGEGSVAAPIAFRQMVQEQAGMRVNAVVERLAKSAEEQAKVVNAVKPERIELGEPGIRGERAAPDPKVIAELDERTSVDLHQLSDAVENVMGGFTPAQIGTMSDEDFASGAEGILALLSGSMRARRSPLIEPVPGNPSPGQTAAFLKDLAPGIQRIANEAMEMDPAKPESCQACGPVSLGVREPLRKALQQKFPDADMDVILEPGSLYSLGEATPHVFLRIVRRTGKFTIESLAVADFTAAQKPKNMEALGLRPEESVILPWERDLYEKKYPMSLPSGSDRVRMVERIEAARGPRSQELERRLSVYLNISLKNKQNP